MTQARSALESVEADGSLRSMESCQCAECTLQGIAPLWSWLLLPMHCCPAELNPWVGEWREEARREWRASSEAEMRANSTPIST